jgi:hypothetical protein
VSGGGGGGGGRGGVQADCACRLRHSNLQPTEKHIYCMTQHGMGLVHTAPGHEQEDYQVCVQCTMLASSLLMSYSYQACNLCDLVSCLTRPVDLRQGQQ